MGGPSNYDNDVGQRARSTVNIEEHFRPVSVRAEVPVNNRRDNSTSTTSNRRETRELIISPLQDPKKLRRECLDDQFHPQTTPIVVAMDITESRKNDIRIIFDKLGMFLGQIVMCDYASNPAISFAAVGDATAGDKFPIQSGEFEFDNRLDDSLMAIILENGGGGGTGQESYHLMAYFYAKYSKLDCNTRGQKGFFFFIGDEGFYPSVSKKEVKKVFGEDIPDDIDSVEVFKKLQEKYHVFFIYQQKSWEDRVKDADSEIKKRVEKAGGLYEGVDLRASLIWNNFNDLDLHCITPEGGHIYYSNRRVGYGELDVDRNVQHNDPKPVENIRWEKGKAQKGVYKFYVENFSFAFENYQSTPFEVEIEANGEIQHFNLKTSFGKTREDSRVEVASISFDPSQARVNNTPLYSNYQQSVVLDQWASVIPKENILIIEQPKAVVDTMLGTLALVGGKTLSEYIKDMANRDQTIERQEQVKKTLADLSITFGSPKVNLSGLINENASSTISTGRKISRI